MLTHVQMQELEPVNTMPSGRTYRPEGHISSSASSVKVKPHIVTEASRFSALVWRSEYDVRLRLLSLVARQHRSQKSEFRLHFGGIGDSIRDFLTKEFAIPLAKPVDRNFEGSL